MREAHAMSYVVIALLLSTAFGLSGRFALLAVVFAAFFIYLFR
jgi:hypothetical protein